MIPVLTLPIPSTALPAGTSMRPGLWPAAMARLASAIAALRETSTDSTRLNAHTMRDIGLLPEQSPDEPIWGYGGIMWRP